MKLDTQGRTVVLTSMTASHPLARMVSNINGNHRLKFIASLHTRSPLHPSIVPLLLKTCTPTISRSCAVAFLHSCAVALLLCCTPALLLPFASSELPSYQFTLLPYCILTFLSFCLPALLHFCSFTLFSSYSHSLPFTPTRPVSSATRVLLFFTVALLHTHFPSILNFNALPFPTLLCSFTLYLTSPLTIIDRFVSPFTCFINFFLLF